MSEREVVARCLSLLYPDGLQPHQYGGALSLAWVLEQVIRGKRVVDAVVDDDPVPAPLVSAVTHVTTPIDVDAYDWVRRKSGFSEAEWRQGFWIYGGSGERPVSQDKSRYAVYSGAGLIPPSSTVRFWAGTWQWWARCAPDGGPPR